MSVALACLTALSIPIATPASAVDIGERFTTGGAAEVSASPWWDSVGDSNLTDLVNAALRGNLDARAAAARLLQAQAIADQTRAPMYPWLSARASANLSPYNGLGFQFGGLPGASMTEQPDVLITTSATLNAQYQIDSLWRQAVVQRAAALNADATSEDRDNFGLMIATQVAEAYYDVVAATEQVEIIEAQIAVNASLLELVELRFARGEASGLDVLQQRQQVASAKARLPDARARARVQSQRLLVLIGRPPSAEMPQTLVKLPTLGALPPTGTPRDLATNRPNLRAALHRWHAAVERVTAAERGHFPTLGLSASAGVQGRFADEWTSQETWGIGLALSVPIFRGFNDVSAVKAASAEEAVARYSYSQLLLQAVAEVESALTRHAEQSLALDALEAQREAAALALGESKARYVNGLSSYLSVLIAINGLHGAELGIIAAKRARLSTRLAVHAAVGGPWTKGLLDRIEGGSP